MDWKIEAAIESLLKKKIGLNASTLGSSTVIEKAVSDRMNDCGIFDVPTYLIHLQSSPQEWDALIEKLIVPETWFFRDREAFNFLRQYILSEWLTNQSSQGLRVLSVPCSTGEEPYSIAMILLDMGLNYHQFRVDAVDISQLSLQKAKRGIYGKHSFRGQSFASLSSQGFTFRDRYFEAIENSETYQISSTVKKTVNFISGNLIDPFFVQSLSNNYQVIFCRNLLIYFDDDSRKKAIQVMNRLLNPEGVLFVGSAETGALMGQNFISVRHPMSFAYRKTETQKPKHQEFSTPKTLKKYSLSNSLIQSSQIHRKEIPNKIIKYPQKKAPEKTEINLLKIPQTIQSNLNENFGDNLLENARTLANQGKLQESVNLCQTYLTQNPTSVLAYVLLGEVHQALGNDDRAEQFFQKAVYLEPNHYEALMHLALLQEQRGNISNAALLRQRIQRLDRQ